MSNVMERPQLAFSAEALRLDAAAATDPRAGVAPAA
jgi:hypothetical protein